MIALFDHHDDNKLKYTTIDTYVGTEITHSHLIYKANHGNSSQLQNLYTHSTSFYFKNDYIFIRLSERNELHPSKVVKVTITSLTLLSFNPRRNHRSGQYPRFDDMLSLTIIVWVTPLYSPTEAALSLHAQISEGERGRDVAILVPQTARDSW